MQREIRHSACPHDCPSTCALEIEVLDGKRIGSVRGAEANSYTSGVVCAKVARYAERIHHPDRVTRPLLRTGPKGSGQFRAISWDEALDRVAEAFITTARLHGAEAVWPYYYAGTMGLVQRDGINRLRHVMRYSRHGQDHLHLDLRGRLDGWCRPLHRTGPARNGALRPHRDVGRQSGRHTGQRDDAYHARTEGAWCEACGGRSVSHRHGGGRRYASGFAARDGRRAGLRGDARRVPGWLRRSRLPGQFFRLSSRAGGASCGAFA